MHKEKEISKRQVEHPRGWRKPSGVEGQTTQDKERGAAAIQKANEELYEEGEKELYGLAKQRHRLGKIYKVEWWKIKMET